MYFACFFLPGYIEGKAPMCGGLDVYSLLHPTRLPSSVTMALTRFVSTVFVAGCLSRPRLTSWTLEAVGVEVESGGDRQYLPLLSTTHY